MGVPRERGPSVCTHNHHRMGFGVKPGHWAGHGSQLWVALGTLRERLVATMARAFGDSLVGHGSQLWVALGHTSGWPWGPSGTSWWPPQHGRLGTHWASRG